MIPSLEEITARLVAKPSVSSPDARFDQSNRAAIDELATLAESVGFRVTLQPIEEGPNPKTNLIAVLGDGPGGLVLSGHTDTVPFDAAKWDSDPFELTEREGRLYGLGSADMKGFFAAALHAASKYAGAGKERLREPLVLLATADEESTMDGARALANATLPTATRAIIGEPTGLSPVHMHKGILMEALSLTGRSGHSSNPALGHSALEGMHKAIGGLLGVRDALKEEMAPHGGAFAVSEPTLNLGRIEGGDSPNRICGQCTLSYDVRILPAMEAEATSRRIRQAVESALAQELGGQELKLVWEELAQAIPPFRTARDAETVRVIEEMTGQEAQAVMFCTEAPFLAAMGMETVVCGAGSIDVAHQPNEYVSRQGLRDAAELYGGLIHRFCVES